MTAYPMSAKVFVLFVLLLVYHAGFTQDIPLFNQKLTRSFLYNPALAGLGASSVKYSYLKSYAQVNDAPETMMLGLQTPFGSDRFGTGIILLNDRVNFFRNSIICSAFAYHLRMNKSTTLSTGVSGEYNRMGVVGDINFSSTGVDPVLERIREGAQTTFDIAFGMHFQNARVQGGLSLNRLRSLLYERDGTLSPYYSCYIQPTVSANTSYKLESFIAVRRVSNTDFFADLGIYITLHKKFIFGGSYKTLGAFSFHLAYLMDSKMMVSYSRESYIGSGAEGLGTTNEFDLSLEHARPQKIRYICYGMPEKKKMKPRSLDKSPAFRKRKVKR
jgi:type IX secretion system PorP/SprF family membrane protein